MADPIIPYYVNDIGSENIRVSHKKFKCMGASPPLDHPHVFLDMGAEGQVICPYCSTLYVMDSKLGDYETNPAGCTFNAPDKVES